MFNNPVLTNTDSIDFAELAPSIVARVGRISTTTNNVTTTTTTGALSTDGGTTWTPFATLPPIGAGAVTNIAVSADGATLVWDHPPARAPRHRRPLRVARPRRQPGRRAPASARCARSSRIG